jgi:cytidylate kinase
VPDAPVKVFLTADETARAQRRARETSGAVGATREAIARRDRLDAGRSASPMAQAADAVVIDSSGLRADEVIEQVVALARTAVQA